MSEISTIFWWMRAMNRMGAPGSLYQQVKMHGAGDPSQVPTYNEAMMLIQNVYQENKQPI